jgi:hypothetical protein
MGLFSKSKESADLKQAQEIKDVSTELPNPSMPANMPNLESVEQPQLNLNQNSLEQDTNTTFNNPFAQNSQPVAEPNTMQTQQPAAMPPTPQTNSEPIQPISIPTAIPEPMPNPQTQMAQSPNPPINDLMPQTNPMSATVEQPATQPIAEQNSIFNTNQPAAQPPQSSLPSDITGNPQPITTGPVATSQPIRQNIIPQEKENFTKDRIQELVDETVEQVIEERWQQIVEKIEKVAQWKDKQEQHINLIKEDILTMKESFEKLEKRIINKVSDYDKNILDVNSEIKALEKVFQKITPTLVNNVNELSNIAKTFKADSKTENIE